ncbi:splicing factor YJU2-like [Pholidichthys leucotaenia]
MKWRGLIPKKSTFYTLYLSNQSDPENTDYAMEHGATRNFQAEKLIEEEEKRIQQEREEEELNNPMKVLENRTKDSKMEMEMLENLQELKELNQRQTQVDFEGMIDHYHSWRREREREKEEDERETKQVNVCRNTEGDCSCGDYDLGPSSQLQGA